MSLTLHIRLLSCLRHLPQELNHKTEDGAVVFRGLVSEQELLTTFQKKTEFLQELKRIPSTPKAPPPILQKYKLNSSM